MTSKTVTLTDERHGDKMTRWEAETILSRYQNGDTPELRPLCPSERAEREKEAGPYEDTGKPRDMRMNGLPH